MNDTARRPATALLGAFLTLSTPGAALAQTALDGYVQRPDPHFAWDVVDQQDGIFADAYLLHLTSQQWRGADEVDRPLWRHELTVFDPEFALCGGNDSPSTAVLLINGGSNPLDDELDDDNTDFAQLAAITFCSVVAVVDQIPNQPLSFSDEPRRPRKEDAIIAYSFDKFLRTGDPEWPLQVAMTKAASAAMTAVQQLSRSGRGIPDIDDFIVLGGSKRGWTTWLTAAVDDRVKAILPISIDMLNLDRQFPHHWQAYGFYAPAVYDYLEFDINCRLDGAAGQALLDIVDPLSYAARYTMPKLVINSAGDQFFVSDSSRFYYDLLPAPKWLRYTANTDHAQGEIEDIAELILSARSWIDDINDGKQPPRYDWRFLDDGAIEVRVFERPERVRLWQAHNPVSRDFRLESLGAVWQSGTLDDAGDGLYIGRVEAPGQGFRAFFVEVEFEEGALLEANQTFTSGVRVVPDILPFAGTDCRPFPDYSNLWWNPRLPGQALQLLQQGGDLSGAWYLYDGEGAGFWVTFVGRLGNDGRGQFARGALYRFTGPPPGDGFDSGQVRGRVAGNATLRFRSTTSATLDYMLNGVDGTFNLVPFERLADEDYSDIWYDPAQSGQGVQLLRRDGRLAGAWYLYRGDGSADWLTFDGLLQGDVTETDLWRFRGPALGAVWDEDDVVSERAGRVRVTLDDGQRVLLSYTLDGVAGTLDLQRFRH